ncbi:hypothetical protein D3C80_1191600 [compost metagenome]
MQRNPDLCRVLDQGRTHHSGHATAAQISRQQLGAAHQEQIAVDPFDDATGNIAHQSFGMLGILPFGTRQHLFKSIEVFEPGQQRLFRQASATGKKTNPVLGMLGRINGQGTALQDTPWCRASSRRIATLAVTTDENQFEYAVTQQAGVTA